MNEKEDSKSEWEISIMAEFEAWINSPQCLEMINLIAVNSNKGGWDKEPHITIELTKGDTASYARMLLHHRMMCYFTDCCPLLPDLKHWTANVLVGEKNWPIKHVKFVGRNFYLMIFKLSEHRTLVLAAKPWFVEQN